MSESNGNGNGNGAGKLAALFPSLAENADSLEFPIPLVPPSGEDLGVFAVFGVFDPKTRRQYNSLKFKLGKRGKVDLEQSGEAANKYLFKEKCKRIEGLTADECDGKDPKEFMLTTPDCITAINASVNQYVEEQTLSADDSSKSS